MKRFSQYKTEYEVLAEEVLTEKVQAMWIRSAFMHMMNSYIMITDNIYKKGKQDIPKAHTWHTTSEKRFKDLVGIQRSNKTVSARPSFDPGNEVWEAGYTCKLHGQVLFGMDYDLMSVPDQSGRRWIAPWQFAKSYSYGSDDYGSNLSDEDWQKRQIQRFRKGFAKQLRSRFKVPQLGTGNSDDIWVFQLIKFLETKLHFSQNHSSTSQKTVDAIKRGSEGPLTQNVIEAWFKLKEKAADLLQKAVADWIRLSEKIMSKRVAAIKNTLKMLFQGSSDNYDAEILVNQFRIDAVLLEGNASLYSGESFEKTLKDHYKKITKLVPDADVFWLDDGRSMPESSRIEMLEKFPYAELGNDYYYQLDMFGGNLVIDKVSDDVFGKGDRP